MSIPNNTNKIKRALGFQAKKPFSLAILLACAFFLVGLSLLDIDIAGTGRGIRVYQDISVSKEGKVIASRKSHRCFYPWCSEAFSTKIGDRAVFDSIQEAVQAGFTPSSRCAGLPK